MISETIPATLEDAQETPSSHSSWAWKELATSCVFSLGAEDSQAIKEASLTVAAEYCRYPLDDSRVLAAAASAARNLPAPLIEKLVDFRVDGNEAGAMLVKNVPVDDILPPTPPDGMAPADWTRLPVTSISHLAIMSVLGDPIAYADEKAGRVIQDTIPVRGAERRQENTSSALLELHVEDCFHPFKPHFLGLHCLRPDHSRTGLTVVGDVRSALSELPVKTVHQLRQPVYHVRLSTSFVAPGAPRYSDMMPALAGPSHDPEICVGFTATDSTTAGGTRALDALFNVVSRNLTGVILDRADLLIVDNLRAVHGRTGFTPRYDGTDRWLRRCFVVADIHRSRAVRKPGSRVCDPYILGAAYGRTRDEAWWASHAR